MYLPSIHPWREDEIRCTERDFFDTMTPFYERLPHVAGTMPRLIEAALARLAAWSHAPPDRDRRSAVSSGSPASR